MQISGEFHSSTALIPGKNPPLTTDKGAGGDFTLGLRMLKKEENFILCRESNKYSSDHQSVATYYTDSAIQAAGVWDFRKNFYCALNYFSLLIAKQVFSATPRK